MAAGPPPRGSSSSSSHHHHPPPPPPPKILLAKPPLPHASSSGADDDGGVPGGAGGRARQAPQPGSLSLVSDSWEAHTDKILPVRAAPAPFAVMSVGTASAGGFTFTGFHMYNWRLVFRCQAEIGFTDGYS